MMIKKSFSFGWAIALTLLIQGCASEKAVEVVKPHYLTKINTEYGYITPQEIGGESAVAVAVINVDFSKTHILFDFNIGTFQPKEGRGDLYLKVTGSGKFLGSLAELQAEMVPHIQGMPIGIIMMVNGTPLGVGGNTPKPEQNDFFHDFAEMMATAGIKYAYLVPEKVSLTR